MPTCRLLPWDPAESTIQSGNLSIRTKFEDYTGLFVMHCHRLNHEDNGLMTLVNVIPAVSTYAVAVRGSPGHAAEVKVYDGNGDRLIATVTPFPEFEGDVERGHGGRQRRQRPTILSSARGRTTRRWSSPTLARRLTTRRPSRRSSHGLRRSILSARGGVSVTSTQIDGTTADNIIVGSGPGIASEVKVFGTELPSSLGTAPALFSTFNPYANDRSGVSVASGFVDFATGRNSIVTAPGPGTPTQVKVFSFSLMKPLHAPPTDVAEKKQCPGPKEAAVTAAFMPFGLGYSGGVSLATGWVTGALGRRRGDRRWPAERSWHGESLLERLGTAGRTEESICRALRTHSDPNLYRRSRNSTRSTRPPECASQRRARRLAQTFS